MIIIKHKYMHIQTNEGTQNTSQTFKLFKEKNEKQETTVTDT